MTQEHKHCTKCGDEIMKIVTADQRIVDFEILGLCPSCAGEEGMGLDESMAALTKAMEALAEISPMGYDLERQ